MRPLMTRSRVLSAFVFLAGTLVAACTAMTDGTATQCRSQADCLSRGPEFVDTTCSAERVCVKLTVRDDACKSNSECIDRAGGAPSMCRKADRTCVLLQSTDCPRVFADKDDLTNDEAIHIGMLGPQNADGLFLEASVDLARTEIRKTLGGGLPNPDVTKPKRPFVVTYCNVEPVVFGFGSNPEMDRAVAHLTDTLKVPAVVGPFTTGQVLRVLPDLARRDTFAITQNGSPLISTLADKDLVFRSGFNEEVPLAALSPFIQEYLEPRIVTDGVAAAGETIRVLMISVNENQGAGLHPVADAALKVLKFNGGKTVLENQTADAGSFKLLQLSDFQDRIGNPNPDPERARAITETIAFKPHIILWAGSPAPLNSMFIPLARQWPAAVQRPFQIGLIHGWQNFIVTNLQTFPNPVLRQRYFGLRATGYNFAQADFDLWRTQLNFKAPELIGQTIGFNHSHNYDAMYLLAYSIIAMGNEPVTGPNIARGMRKIADETGGTPIKWGPDEMSKAIAALTGGQNIAFSGVLGDYGFNKAGERPGNGDVYCVTAGPNGAPNGVASSGYRYNTQTGRGEGVVACP
jgi:hypothetical protein